MNVHVVDTSNQDSGLFHQAPNTPSLLVIVHAHHFVIANTRRTSPRKDTNRGDRVLRDREVAGLQSTNSQRGPITEKKPGARVTSAIEAKMRNRGGRVLREREVTGLQSTNNQRDPITEKKPGTRVTSAIEAKVRPRRPPNPAVENARNDQ